MHGYSEWLRRVEFEMHDAAKTVVPTGGVLWVVVVNWISFCVGANGYYESCGYGKDVGILMFYPEDNELLPRDVGVKIMDRILCRGDYAGHRYE